MPLKIPINRITSIKKYKDQKERSVSDDMFSMMYTSETHKKKKENDYTIRNILV